MRACWAATLLVMVQPSPASCATCRGTSVAPRVLVLTLRHPHKSPCARPPSVEISGSTAFSSLWFLSRKLCPIFVCQFKGSLHRSFARGEGRAAVAKALLFGRQFRRLTYPPARKRIVPDCASGLVRTDFPPVLYNMCAPHALGLVLS